MTAATQPSTDAWRRAWLGAFQTAAPLSPVVQQGRQLADNGAITDLSIAAGAITGHPHPPARARAIRPRINVMTLNDTEWDRIGRAIAAHPDLADSTRNGILSDELLAPDNTGGVALIPHAREIAFTCACTKPPRTCEHTTALGHLTADHLLTMPTDLLTLRGGSLHLLTQHLRAHEHAARSPRRNPPTPRRTSPATSTARTQPTRSHRPTLPPLPKLTSPSTTALATIKEEPPAPAPPLSILRAIVQDAAHRAQELLKQPQHHSELDPYTDLVRLASTPHGAPHLAAIAEQLGQTPYETRRLADAYTHGGTAGVAVQLHRTAVAPETLAAAESCIQPLRPAPLTAVERDHNHLTDPAARVQLRYGPDAHWHPYSDRHGTWWPAPGHHLDPALAYRAALAASRSRR
ncbi:hypothetical protein OG440_40215 (plasmid) [Streptomyces sp. NBC_00637]|uniref:hypothetical protein n=1 Tax=Streptomyces sp. NBC_00637 TaxID=2903667 RepID=UPI002F90C710